MLRSAAAWRRAITSVRSSRAEQMRVAGLEPQVVLDRDLVADRGGAGDLAGFGLEDGEQAGFGGEPGDLDRVGRGAAPAERAGHQDVQVAGAVEVHRAGRPCTPGRAGRRPWRWRRRGSRGPWRSAGRSCPGRRCCPARGRRRRWWRCARPAGWRRSAARRCSCTPGCRSRCTARRRCARTCPTGSAMPMSTVPPSPPWATTRMSGRPMAFMAAATPEATAGALPNSECSQAICQDVPGRGWRTPRGSRSR